MIKQEGLLKFLTLADLCISSLDEPHGFFYCLTERFILCYATCKFYV